MIQIPMKRISNNTNNYLLMKRAGIHIVTRLYFVSVGEGGWKYTRRNSHIIVNRGNCF